MFNFCLFYEDVFSQRAWNELGEFNDTKPYGKSKENRDNRKEQSVNKRIRTVIKEKKDVCKDPKHNEKKDREQQICGQSRRK